MKRIRRIRNALIIAMTAVLIAGITGCGNDKKEETSENEISQETEESNSEKENSAEKDETAETGAVKKKNIPSVGEKAPEINAFNIDTDEKGSIEELTKDKKLVMTFFGTDCSACRMSMPDFNRLQKEEGDSLNVIAVTAGETKDSISQFREELGLNFPIYLDNEEARTNIDYFVRFIPTTYVINTDGIIETIIPGALEYEQMLELIKG